MSKVLNEETRQLCPKCKGGTIGPGEGACAACRKNEMTGGGGGVTGFQLPLGSDPETVNKRRKTSMDECVRRSGDLTEAHVAAFLRTSDMVTEFVDALDFGQLDEAANIVREDLVRRAVRAKINEVVRKKKGGGGFVLYAPNTGKKGPSHAAGTFPTKLAAKRAELSKFPPKDPKKLAKLRKEIQKLMKDPKKRAEQEKKAKEQGGKGVEPGGKKKKAAKKESFTREEWHAAFLSAMIGNGMRQLLGEGLFQKDSPPSEWDDVLKKISQRVLQSDKGFQRMNMRLQKATEIALSQAVRAVQKQLGTEAKVKAAKSPGQTDGGQPFIPFHIQIEAAQVGPIYLYVDNGLPAIEMSEEAQNSLTKVTPGAAKAIRAALAMAQDVLRKMDTVRLAVQERDAYLDRQEKEVDRIMASLTPLKLSLMKMLYAQKYRSVAK